MKHYSLGQRIPVWLVERYISAYNLTSGTIYFSTGQYQYNVSSLPLFFIFTNIYIYLCVYIIINIKVYHKTLPQFKINYSWF